MAPVTGAVLAHLPALAAGDLLLDVGCGTGEPGLSAARRDPGVRLLGVDTAAAMVEVARYKAQQEQLAAATFEVMAAGELTLADGSVGAVVSRFALLAFPAAAQDGAREVARVLAPGGPYSIATWDRLSLNTLFDATLQTLREHATPAPRPISAGSTTSQRRGGCARPAWPPWTRSPSPGPSSSRTWPACGRRTPSAALRAACPAQASPRQAAVRS